MKKINTVIIQPPLVQLNSPYPSGAYLLSFFKSEYEKRNLSGSVEWLDLSNDFFHSIFSKKGLKKIFDKTIDKALKMAEEFENQNDENSAFELRRFVSQSESWINWIDIIISIVCPSNNSLSGREFVHEFIRGAHVPRGARMEKFLSSLSRDVTTDDAQILASLFLADLADYISLVYDNNFELIRYGESLATSNSSFKKVQQGLSSLSLEDFYKPLLLEKIKKYKNESTLFGFTIPFPGCFEAAVYSADVIRKEKFSDSIIGFGGGYVNTELREIAELKLFDYCDFLSYDKGYGNFIDLFDSIEKNILQDESKKLDSIFDGTSYYNCSYRCKNKIVQKKESELINQVEKKIVRQITPDYESIDFSKYPRLADDKNSMHRIWNDGAWLKAYIAHGCYWHRCAFCDTSLDYVKDYCLTDVNNLFDRLCIQAKKTGVHGIHFVDEACPPISLQQFALRNISLKAKENHLVEPLTFWGNIRFEKTFSRDLADLISAGGMTAVSAGIEIATSTGLDCVNKGTDIENIIFACCAFKEAGILIHSYMIFGFWNQTEQDLINSMETLRQMFEAGLIDSAFWHKFTLTKHSTVYEEYKRGKYPKLKIFQQSDEQFAKNDLHFEGEKKSEKYSLPLNVALENWMHLNKFEKPVETYFPFKMPRPTISKEFVRAVIQKYEKKQEEIFLKIPDTKEKFVWLGGKILELPSSKDLSQLCWSYMGELCYVDVKKTDAKNVINYLEKIKASSFCSACEKKSIDEFFGNKIFDTLGKDLFFVFRSRGLCKLI